MIKVRYNIFETNSSSTHSLNICTREEYEDWKAGYLLYSPDDYKFIDNYLLSEEKKMIRLKEYYETKIKSKFYKNFEDLNKTEINDLLKSAVSDGYMFESGNDIDIYELDYFTYDQYCERYSDLDNYEEYYTTESGDEIVIFGEYGFDG